MFKFMFPALLCAAFVCPSLAYGQDCGCCDSFDPCQQTRKKLALVDVTKSVTRLKRVCETDECGCSRSRLARVSECVTRKKLALVDVPVDPCKRNVLQRMKDKLGSIGNRGCNACDTGCCDTCGGFAGGDAGCGCSGGGEMGYPEISYPSESYPSAAPAGDMYYGGDAGVPIEMSYPSGSGMPTQATPMIENSIIN